MPRITIVMIAAAMFAAPLQAQENAVATNSAADAGALAATDAPVPADPANGLAPATSNAAADMAVPAPAVDDDNGDDDGRRIPWGLLGLLGLAGLLGKRRAGDRPER